MNYTKQFKTREAAEKFCDEHTYAECVIYSSGTCWCVDVWSRT